MRRVGLPPAERDRARIAELGTGAVEFFLRRSKVELMELAYELARLSNGVSCDDHEATMERLRAVNRRPS